MPGILPTIVRIRLPVAPNAAAQTAAVAISMVFVALPIFCMSLRGEIYRKNSFANGQIIILATIGETKLTCPPEIARM